MKSRIAGLLLVTAVHLGATTAVAASPGKAENADHASAGAASLFVLPAVAPHVPPHPPSLLVAPSEDAPSADAAPGKETQSRSVNVDIVGLPSGRSCPQSGAQTAQFEPNHAGRQWPAAPPIISLCVSARPPADGRRSASGR